MSLSSNPNSTYHAVRHKLSFVQNKNRLKKNSIFILFLVVVTIFLVANLDKHLPTSIQQSIQQNTTNPLLLYPVSSKYAHTSYRRALGHV
jgi:hypothetical protein